MCQNLFKQGDLPKIYSDIVKPGEISSRIWEYGRKLPEIKISDQEQEENYPEVTVQTFFDFMRTAYQVNESSEELANTLTANSEIDWTALAKIPLNLEGSQHIESENDTKEKKISQTSDQKDPHTLLSSSKTQSIPINVEHCIKIEHDEKNHILNGRTNNENNTNEPEISPTSCAENKKEPMLSKVMKSCLNDVLHEGLLDSILPHMLPKPTQSQPIIKKSLILDPKKSSCMTGGFEKAANSTNNNKENDIDKNKQKRLTESEVEIHVCDEAKNMKKDFRCPQKLLVQKMCYFADVTAGQKLEEMDISVHCDIVIFDWLMRWVKKDIIKKSEWPLLETNNVIQIILSASFLQMDPLVEDCLIYCHENMPEILKTNTILTRLNVNDNILTRLAELFTNAELEALKDKKDKILSQLFCKLILALANPKPDYQRGHFASLATLFRCAKCEKNVVRSISNSVPCIPSNMKIDNKGNLYSKHTRDMTWSLNDYIVSLRSELQTWRKVYWRLWGDCHFLFCRQCGIYFPVNQMDWCSYHPENPQFFMNEQQRSTLFPLGRYPCCSQRAYRFQVITNRDGCKFREHVPDIVTEKDENIINLFLAHRDTISIEAPQLYFPEKITRLVAHDPLLPPGKLAWKETFWWEGIEIIPPRPKLGLLAKIWGGSCLRKPCHGSQKISKKNRSQMSQTAEASSAASSESCSDDNDEESDGNSSRDDESESENSHGYESSDYSAIKKKKKFNILKRCEGIGSWSPNLTIRYNQDNQRDFEEKAAAQMAALLTKRTILEYNLRSKHHSLGKHTIWNNKSQQIGGTYVKLESEFLNQVNQNNKCKSASLTKGSTRIKSSK